jgi:hypothetical protein
MIEIALAGIYSFASEPPSNDLLEDFIKKLRIFSDKVASLFKKNAIKLFVVNNSL